MMSDQELIFYCGSRSTPGLSHLVSVEWTEEELIIQCDCPAGERSIACRHILGLLKCDATVLTEPANADQLQDLATFQTWLADTMCREDFSRLDQLEQAVKDHKKFKAHISECLSSGWKRKSWMSSGE